MQRDGERTAATVVSVESSIDPPSYGIRLEGAQSIRETEQQRLQPFSAAEAAKDSSAAPSRTPGKHDLAVNN